MLNHEWWDLSHKDVVWMQSMIQHFPELYQIERLLSKYVLVLRLRSYSLYDRRSATEEFSFLKDWYHIFKTCYSYKHTKHQVICIDYGTLKLLHLENLLLQVRIALR